MNNIELRIGNLLDPCDGTNRSYEVDLEFFELLNDGIYHISDFKPIPLTAEWLSRAGFQKDPNFDFRSTLPLPTISDVVDCFLVGISGGNGTLVKYAVNKYWASLDIKFVHQLQNLYFALTGEELTIKEAATA